MNTHANVFVYLFYTHTHTICCLYHTCDINFYRTLSFFGIIHTSVCGYVCVDTNIWTQTTEATLKSSTRAHSSTNHIHAYYKWFSNLIPFSYFPLLLLLTAAAAAACTALQMYFELTAITSSVFEWAREKEKDCKRILGNGLEFICMTISEVYSNFVGGIGIFFIFSTHARLKHTWTWTSINEIVMLF